MRYEHPGFARDVRSQVPRVGVFVHRIVGHESPVIAVELPLTGVDDMVVLGHSYGGLVVSEAASGMSEVSHLVYLAALMLDTGEDMVEFMAAHESEVLVIGVPEGDGFVVDRARTAELLYGDWDESGGRVGIASPKADASSR